MQISFIESREMFRKSRTCLKIKFRDFRKIFMAVPDVFVSLADLLYPHPAALNAGYKISLLLPEARVYPWKNTRLQVRFSEQSSVPTRPVLKVQ